MIYGCWRELSGRQIGKLVDRLQSQYDGNDVQVDDELVWRAWRRRRDVVCRADDDDESAVARGCPVRVELRR